MLKRGKPSNLEEVVDILKEHRSILVDKYGIVEIGVFGSYVRNEQKHGSDIDIVVQLKRETKTLDNFIGLKSYLQKKLRAKVDIVLRDGLKETLKKYILQEAVYV
ncbi:MAG: nucleotidyltransferase family protein [Nitrospirae bacterium]|nr:nucleotidyltransferase family protein [Nitrospirota bacterium]MBF0536548.1 nucleotidyltransferase family protein [Nitrospirota bacterium]MBF0618479.1 nucleotidyltransferase family protein [Nitrospirota bacterium]